MTPEQAVELADLVASIRASVEDAAARFAVVAAGALNLPEVAASPERHEEVAPPSTDEQASIEARLAAAACERCPLARGRRRVVTAEGPHQARLVVVGPPTTFADERDGASMSGEPAVMFEKMLTAVVGVPRDEVVVVPAVMCRPPDGRAPTPSEAAACRPMVMAQVVAAQPSAVLVFGEAANAALFGPEPPLKRVRGLWRELEGCPSVATWSPHECLRTPALKRETFEDLVKLKGAVAGP
jgi:uracil-DNA glycosylase family 4